MTVSARIGPDQRPVHRRFGRRDVVLGLAAVAVVLAIALDTKVVKIGSAEDERQAAFSPEAYGAKEFPKLQAAIEARAVDAATLAAALAANKADTIAKYGIASSSGPVFSVRLTGVASDPVSGIYKLAVAGLPDGQAVRLQTGPAINGTEIRDATGTVAFGAFTNQIEYQNAGSALNNEMKKTVLAAIDTTALGGRTVAVVGAFRLINPKNWLVTPVRLEVK